MYCSRRGREVPRPTDTCARCGRCNWEQNGKKSGNSRLWIPLLLAAVLLIAAVMILSIK